MEQSKAINQLGEAADLLAMLESLYTSTAAGQNNSATSAGFRITLRNVREAVLNAHDTLAAGLIAKAKQEVESAGLSSGGAEAMPAAQQPQAVSSMPVQQQSASDSATARQYSANELNIRMQRRDLRATLEKFVERS